MQFTALTMVVCDYTWVMMNHEWIDLQSVNCPLLASWESFIVR